MIEVLPTLEAPKIIILYVVFEGPSRQCFSSMLISSEKKAQKLKQAETGLGEAQSKSTLTLIINLSLLCVTLLNLI